MLCIAHDLVGDAPEHPTADAGTAMGRNGDERAGVGVRCLSDGIRRVVLRHGRVDRETLRPEGLRDFFQLPASLPAHVRVDALPVGQRPRGKHSLNEVLTRLTHHVDRVQRQGPE